MLGSSADDKTQLHGTTRLLRGESCLLSFVSATSQMHVGQQGWMDLNEQVPACSVGPFCSQSFHLFPDPAPSMPRCELEACGMVSVSTFAQWLCFLCSPGRSEAGHSKGALDAQSKPGGCLRRGPGGQSLWGLWGRLRRGLWWQGRGPAGRLWGEGLWRLRRGLSGRLW
jgi:hypothetical protein